MPRVATLSARALIRDGDHPGGVRLGVWQNKTNMMARKQRLDKMRKALKLQVQLLTSEFDKQKQALATSESAGTLEALEQKLKHHEQNIYHLRDFIDSKEAETDYSGVYEEVSRQVADINTMLQQFYSTPY